MRRLSENFAELFGYFLNYRNVSLGRFSVLKFFDVNKVSYQHLLDDLCSSCSHRFCSYLALDLGLDEVLASWQKMSGYLNNDHSITMKFLSQSF